VHPTKGTRIAAHLLVGGAAALIAAKAFGKNATLVGAPVAIGAQAALDAQPNRNLPATTPLP
jgi:hypothetical protein